MEDHNRTANSFYPSPAGRSKSSKNATRELRDHISSSLSQFHSLSRPCKRHVDRQSRTIKQCRSILCGSPGPVPVPKTKSRKQKKKSLGYQIRSSDRREKQDSLAGISFCVETVVRQYVQKNDVVHDQSRAMHTSVHTAFRDIRGVGWRYVRWCSTTRHRLVMGGRGLRPCAPCGGVADLRRRRSGGRSHLRHTQMLRILLVGCKRQVFREVPTYAFRQCGCTCASGANWGG